VMRRILAVFLGTIVFGCISLRAADATTGVIHEGFLGRVDLIATDRAPDAKGTVRLAGDAPNQTVELTLSHLRPATLFGGDFNTYVVWRISPLQTVNVGEVPLDGSSGRLSFSAPASSFAILVTAEPHYLVDSPSRFVVLESPGDRSMRYHTEVTPYNFRRDTLDGLPVAKGPVFTDVRQAISAVRLARRAATRTGCPSDLSEAQQSLEETLRLARTEADSVELRRQARETVRLAVLACREE
jgi:hypothetical protein